MRKSFCFFFQKEALSYLKGLRPVPRNPYYAGPPSAHFDGTRFFNPGQPTTDRPLGDLLRWRLLAKRAPWPDFVATSPVKPDPRSDALRITMVGHATVLVQVAGRNIVVDPVWSERASPFTWAGPRRMTAPGIRLDDLPPLDTVLLTHNHYDHLDIATLKNLWRQHRPRIIAALGNDAVVAGLAPGIDVEAYDWYETTELGEGVCVTLHPAHHWSARGARDRRKALWCGFVLATPRGNVYIAGDTGYGGGAIFRDVQTRHGAPDVAVLPIGAYEPRWFMQGQHVNPDEAVRIMLDTGAVQALGVHWGTFNLTDEPRLQPRAHLQSALAERGLPADKFIALEPGDTWPAR
jgi:L-ascorbate metabolism protein UlaG (beta-lactamase superfamily)